MMIAKRINENDEELLKIWQYGENLESFKM